MKHIPIIEAKYGSLRIRAQQAWIDRPGQWLRAWERALERARQRRQLRRLDDRLLKDIGLSRADVEREADKPWWKP